MRASLVFFLLGGAAAATAGMAACGDDDSTSASSTNSSTTTGAGGTGGTPNTNSSSTTTSTGGGGEGPGHCVKGCTTPADCCGPGQGDCPSDQYPGNYTCDNGICGPPECAQKEDCTVGGELPLYDCLPVNGFNSCGLPCTTNGECTPTTCSGTDDNGNKFCKSEPMPFVCRDSLECNGLGICETGSCVCHQDGDCTHVFADKCVN